MGPPCTHTPTAPLTHTAASGWFHPLTFLDLPLALQKVLPEVSMESIATHLKRSLKDMSEPLIQFQYFSDVLNTPGDKSNERAAESVSGRECVRA